MEGSTGAPVVAAVVFEVGRLWDQLGGLRDRRLLLSLARCGVDANKREERGSGVIGKRARQNGDRWMSDRGQPKWVK